MNRTIPIAVAAVAIVAPAAFEQRPVRAQAPAMTLGVRDRARLFSPEAVIPADRTLREVSAEGHWQVLIETRDSLDGKLPRDVALANAQAAKLHGLSIVIAKADKKVWTMPSGSAEATFPKREETLINEAFTRSFFKGDYDRGLLDAVDEIRRAALGFGVRDYAKMFSLDAVAKANQSLADVRRKTRWSAVIETVESLGGQTARDVAIANAKAIQVHGLYLLIAKQEHKLRAVPSQAARSVFTPEKIRAIDDAVATAFKMKEFDTGLGDATDQVRRAAESDTRIAVRGTEPPAATKKADAKEEPLALPGPDGPSPPARATNPPKALPPPAPNVPATSGRQTGSSLPVLLIGAGAVLVVLWLLARAFRPPAAQPQAPSQAAAPGYGPGYAPSPGPASRAGVPPQPGYGPQQGFGQQAGYGAQAGYGQPPGYGPPPQRGGGGFVSGALGGLAGAVAGNIIYDQFGRPHEQHIPTQGSSGAAPPYEGHSHPSQQAGAEPAQPTERYDPNAGAGADWGTPTDSSSSTDQAGAGADWGSPEPASGTPEPEGGDWGAPDQESTAADVGGDWGGGESNEPEPDAGSDWGGAEADPGADNGGDWGSGDSGGGDEDQGGGW
jgi:uncharacterized membrane protein YgcG